MTEQLSPDGRVQRGVRSRQRIIAAVIGLVEEGDLLPTGEQVAKRAGVGLRTVFRHFEDMESLYAETNEALRERLRPFLEEPVPQGSLEARVDAFARRRANLFERVTPFKRSEALQRWQSPFLQQTHARFVRELRADLRRALPEMDALPPPLRQALELVSSFGAWDRLRADQGLGRERAKEVVAEAILATLTAQAR